MLSCVVSTGICLTLQDSAVQRGCTILYVHQQQKIIPLYYIVVSYVCVFFLSWTENSLRATTLISLYLWFQPFSSHGTHKLVTQILRHTKKYIFCWSDKKMVWFWFIHINGYCCNGCCHIFNLCWYFFF